MDAIRKQHIETLQNVGAHIKYNEEYGGIYYTSAFCKAIEFVLKLMEDSEQQWIPVTERLPESNKPVLISVECKSSGSRHILRAAHIGHHEATTEDYGWREYEGDTEYDGEKDCFWVPECWWEDNFMDDNSNWIIDSDCEVTHWMPLPNPLGKDGA